MSGLYKSQQPLTPSDYSQISHTIWELQFEYKSQEISNNEN